MARQGGYASTLAVCLALTGCASIGDVAARHDSILAQLAERLDRDDWRPDPAWSPEHKDQLRWRLGLSSPAVDGDGSAATIETLLAEWDNRGPAGRDGHPLLILSGRSGRVGANAAILLAQSDPVTAAPLAGRLAGLVTGDAPEPTASSDFASLLTRVGLISAEAAKNDRPSDMTRAAAAEAWCRLLAAGEGCAEGRLAVPGRAWQRTDLPDLVRGELLRGLARHLPPERIVGYGDLFVGGPSAVPVELRRAAIDGCVLFAAGHPDRAFMPGDWPGTVENAGFDIDPPVRRGYGRWAALARRPEAVTILNAQLQDTDPETSAAAVESLGLLRTDAARAALEVVAAKPSETLRAAAAGSLAAWGAAALRPLMSDESPHVRRAAVAALGRCPSPDAAVLLDSVIADGDLDVQRCAVAATADWPDELALPVLSASLQNSALRTRREALDELRRRTGFADPFPVAGEPAEREAAVREVAAKYGWPLDGLTRFRLVESDSLKERSAPSNSLWRLADPAVTAADQEAVFARLREAGPAAVPPIESFCLDHPGPVAERLLAELLPSLSLAHAAAVELASDDVVIRRHGAGRLAEFGRTATLSPLVLRRVHERLAREQDGLVWRQVMTAVAEDATPEAEQVALLALNNAWPDVRRLGCEYVSRHARSNHATWVLPLLSDENDSVRLAAINALGRCGASAGPESAAGLRAAAAGSDRAVRFAALAALARLGDESGSAGLLRWAEYEPPPDRIRAIEALAATGRRRFEPDLARLAWTERDALVRRELLAALEILVPPGQRPAGADAASPEDRVKAWASRWEGPGSTMSLPDAEAGPTPAAAGAEPEPPHVR